MHQRGQGRGLPPGGPAFSRGMPVEPDRRPADGQWGRARRESMGDRAANIRVRSGDFGGENGHFLAPAGAFNCAAERNCSGESYLRQLHLSEIDCSKGPEHNPLPVKNPLFD